MQDKPIRFNSRITITNQAFLNELKDKYKEEDISKVFRKLLYNAEELYRFGIDIYNVETIKCIKDKFNA